MSKVITTPVGVARYPHINHPNKTFDPQGVYTCDVVVSEKEAKTFAEMLDVIRQKAFEKECDEKGKKLRLASTFPVQELEDGTWIIKTKQVAQRETKKGDVYKFTVKLFDSEGKPTNCDVGAGSKVKAAFEPRCWYNPSLGFGMTLGLKAVQVLDLVAPSSSSGSAEAFGFSAEESGFVSDGESFEEALDTTSNADF